MRRVWLVASREFLAAVANRGFVIGLLLMPAIFAGMRIGLGRAITGMVMVELILVASGLGRLLLEFSGRMQSDMVFATVLAVIIEALALLAIMQAIERKLTGWAPNVSVG